MQELFICEMLVCWAKNEKKCGTWVLARCVHGRKARWCVFQRTENVSQWHSQGYKKIGACPALQFNTQTVVWDGRNVKSMFKMFENYIRNSGKVSFRPVLLRDHLES